MTSPHSHRVLRATLVVVALQVVYVFFFVYPGHDPKPNGLKLGIVGTTQEAAAARKQVSATLPGAHLVTERSSEGARAAIKDRELFGALVFGRSGEEVLTASAASFTISSILTQTALQAKVGRVQDVVPLSSGDKRGVLFNLLVVPLVVTGLLGAQLASQTVGRIALRRRVWTVSVVATVSALAVTALIGPVLGTLPGPFVPESGVLALAIFGLLNIGGSLFRLVGPAGLGVSFALFLMLGNPASGAASAPELLPTPWSQLGGFLTPGAVASALRSVAYFDGARLAGPLAVLGVLAVVGVALEALADRRQSSAPDPAPTATTSSAMEAAA